MPIISIGQMPRMTCYPVLDVPRYREPRNTPTPRFEQRELGLTQLPNQGPKGEAGVRRGTRNHNEYPLYSAPEHPGLKAQAEK